MAPQPDWRTHRVHAPVARIAVRPTIGLPSRDPIPLPLRDPLTNSADDPLRTTAGRASGFDTEMSKEEGRVFLCRAWAPG